MQPLMRYGQTGELIHLLNSVLFTRDRLNTVLDNANSLFEKA